MSLTGQIEKTKIGSACADPLPDSSPTRGPAAAPPAPPVARPATGLFVATDLRHWATDEPNIFASDTKLDGVMYRKLDTEYYAWLWSRVQCVIAAFDAHRIERAAFDSVIDRWAAIYKWALDTWGPEALNAAAQAGDPRLYSPPRAATILR